MIITSSFKSLRWLIGLSLLSALGCSGGVSQADPASAHESLTAALNAWKAGSKPEDLASQSPHIKVSDLDWSKGWKLVDYRADAEGKLVGFDMNFPVELSLKKPDGRSATKKAVYTVTTQPEILVLRQEG